MNLFKNILQRKRPILKIIISYSPYLLLLFFAFSFFFRSDVSFDQDLGRHLKLGQIIVQTLQVPKINLFSYTNPGFPFINHHWLFEVIAYLGNITIGVQALLIIKLIILLCVTFVSLVLARRTKSALFIPISFLFLHLLRERTDFRPEIFSFLFTVITFYILDKFEKSESKLIYLLPLISLIWVNTHIYFPVGIFLQLIFLASFLFQRFFQKNSKPETLRKIKTLGAITGASIVVSLLNPNFLTGALYPFTVFNNYGVAITENQTVFTLINIGFPDQNFLFYYIAGFIVLASIYFSLWRKPNFKNILLSLLGLGLASQSIRGFPYLVFISLPAVLQNFSYQKSNFATKILNLIVVILICVEAIFYFNGNYHFLTYLPNKASLTFDQDAKPALDFLLKNNLPQPIFNNFDIGSYIIYRAYPKYKVFIDGRPEAYRASFFQKIYLPMQENYQLFKKEDKNYNFKTVIFSITDQNPRTINFLNLITKDPAWKTVFLDQFMIILVRNGFENNLKTIDLNALNPNNYNYKDCVAYTNLSAFLCNTQHLNRGEAFDEKALKLCPNNPAANDIMANILAREGKSQNLVSQYSAKAKNWVFW